MIVHVLPGDALAEDFKNSMIEGETVICRECLIEGDVQSANLQDFWQTRAEFIAESYGANIEDYFRRVAREFDALKGFAAAGAEINLWFEYELFCQVNMWFCLYFLRAGEAKIYRVAPIVRDENEIWKGFGDLPAEDLKKCFAGRAEFSEKDVSLGENLWTAYQNKDYAALEKLSETESKCFPRLKEVCRAEIEKKTRPKNILREIIKDGEREFAEIFSEFSKRAGVYGFGDAQVRKILSEI